MSCNGRDNPATLNTAAGDCAARREHAKNVFEVRYGETVDPDKNRWELCSRVLARKDVIEKLSESW